MAIAKKVAKLQRRWPQRNLHTAPFTLKHIAAALADSHEIAKKQGEAVLGDLVTLPPVIGRGATNPSDRSRILQVRERAARMGRNPRPARPSRSGPARRSHSGLPGN